MPYTYDFASDELYSATQGHLPTAHGLKPWVNVTKALGILLINDVVQVAGRGASGYDELIVALPLNGVFLSGSVDQEKITFGDIELLYRFWRTDPLTGALAWAVRRRGGTVWLTPFFFTLLMDAGWNPDYLEIGDDLEFIKALSKETYRIFDPLLNVNGIPFYRGSTVESTVMDETSSIVE
jgi:hypothetical protein